MIDINLWMNTFLQSLEETFGKRIWFAGLQGSYGRGEATDNSDIDVVVILDELTPKDIKTYDKMLGTLENRELICGFLSGKNELLSWDTSDLFQFFNDTNPIIGSLKELLPLIDDDAVNRSIKTAVCNIYHGCVHNMLCEKSTDILKGLYKTAYFTVQAIAFNETDRYIRHQEALLESVQESEQTIIKNYLSLKNGDDVNFDEMCNTLFLWAGKRITDDSE